MRLFGLHIGHRMSVGEAQAANVEAWRGILDIITSTKAKIETLPASKEVHDLHYELTLLEKRVCATMAAPRGGRL